VNACGVISHRELAAGRTPCSSDCGSTSDPQAELRTLSIAGRQMVRSESPLVWSELLIMDEPTSALTRGTLSTCSHHSRAGSAGERDPLHHPQNGRAVRDRGRGFPYSATAIHWNGESFFNLTRDEIIRMMVAGAGADFPQGAGLPGRGRIVRAQADPGATVPRHYFRPARGEILGIAGLVGSGAASSPRPCSGLAPASSGQQHQRPRHPAARATPPPAPRPGH